MSRRERQYAYMNSNKKCWGIPPGLTIEKKTLERPEFEYVWSEKRKRFYKKAVSKVGRRRASKVLKNIEHHEKGLTTEYHENINKTHMLNI